MRGMGKRYGVTIVEIIIMLAIVTLLALTLIPVFSHAHEHSQQATCLSRQRDIAALAVTYAADHDGAYPGRTWVFDINAYAPDPERFRCPNANDDKQQISYGYNALLVRPNGKGVQEADLRQPTDVGLTCDVQAPRNFPNGDLIGNSPVTPTQLPALVPAPRHSRGTLVSYADGHATFVPGGYNEHDPLNGVTRAFNTAAALSKVNNPGGGLDAGPAKADESTAPVTVGGDYVVAPLLLAAAEAWQARTHAPMGYAGWNGSGAAAKHALGTVVRGIASDQPPARATAVASDAVLIIVSKQCKINSFQAGTGINAGGLRWSMASARDTTHATYLLNSAQIAALFDANTGTVAQSYQAYTFTRMRAPSGAYCQGSLRYFLSRVIPGHNIGKNAIEVDNDLEMVDKVANDPYGIGYCSSAMVDLERVEVAGIVDAQGAAHFWPTNNLHGRYTMPATAKESNWPYKRTLYVQSGDMKTPGSFGHEVFSTPGGILAAIQHGPMFHANYWAPER